MKNNLFKKGMAIGIMTLFIGMSTIVSAGIAPVEKQVLINDLIKKDKIISTNEFYFLQHWPDGKNMLSSVNCTLCSLDTEVVDDFSISEAVNIYESRFRIVTDNGLGPGAIEGVNVFFYEDIGNGPSTERYAERSAAVHSWYSGREYFGRPELFVECLFEHVVLHPGKWWICFQSIAEEVCFWLTNDGYGDSIWISNPDEGYPKWTNGYDVYGEDYDVCFFLRGNYGEIPPEEDLICYDYGLDWYGVPPGATVEGYIDVWNDGDFGSVLFWEIESWPEWGNWSFDGFLEALPGQGGTTILVEVVVPDEPDSSWGGEIKIVNKNNPDDFEIIYVSVIVPVNYNPIVTFIKNINQRFLYSFPILRQILGL